MQKFKKAAVESYVAAIALGWIFRKAFCISPTSSQLPSRNG